MSTTRVDRSIGKKFGGLLQGLLGGLYDTSSVDVNTGFDPNMPIGDTNVPYSGAGLFGGIKAKGANAQFVAQNAMADLNKKRQLEYLKASLPIQNASAIDLATKQHALEKQFSDAELGDTGAALGTALAQLPDNQFASLNPPTTFKSPQEQANWYASAYGANTPVVKAPIIAQDAANQFAVNSDPRVISAMKSKAIGEGLYKTQDSNINLDTNVDIHGASTRYKENIIPITKKVLNPETGAFEDSVIGYKTERIPYDVPGGIYNLKDNRITPEDVAATAGVNPGANGGTIPLNPEQQSGLGVTPPTTVIPPITTKPTAKPTPVTAHKDSSYEGLIPSMAEGINKFIGNAASSAQQLLPAMPDISPEIQSAGNEAFNTASQVNSIRQALIRGKAEMPMGQVPNGEIPLFPDAYVGVIRKMLDAAASPIRDVGTGVGAMLNPDKDLNSPLPIPNKDIVRYLQNRANNPKFHQLSIYGR